MQPKVRFRRELGQGTPSKIVDFHNDHRGTAAEAESNRVKAEVAANVASSGWSDSYDEAKTTRVIYATAGVERELEFDSAELAALGELARARGVHNASTSADEKAAAELGDLPERLIPPTSGSCGA